jgi:iron complex outermembrane recepter protein
MKARTFYTAALMSACALSGVSIAQAMQDSKPVTFRIDAPSMTEALLQFTQQSHLQLAYSGEKPLELKAPKVEGKLTPKAALERLLRGTGLQYEFVNDRTVSIRRADSTSTQAEKTSQNSDPAESPLRLADAGTSSSSFATDTASGGPDASQTQGEKAIEQVVVTGSHIRGAPQSSTTIKIGREDIERSGYTAVGDVIRSLPQNFGGGNNPQVTVGAAPGENNSPSGGTTPNLRGLGAGSTLTLIDGRRLGADFGGVSDISLIPLEVVDHVEVVLDGASATYGSDAVAGVVNFVLKKDYEGAATSVSAGRATEGGGFTRRVSQTLGTGWNSGGVVFAYEHEKQDAVDASERDFTSTVLTPYSLLPAASRDSAFLSLRQDLTDAVSVSLEGVYASRDSEYLQTFPPSFSSPGDVTQYVASAGVNVRLPSDWRASLYGMTARQDTEIKTFQFTPGLSDQTLLSAESFGGRTTSADFVADGSMFTLPAGAVRAAIGLGYRKETYLDRNPESPLPFADGDRQVKYLFGEFLIPLVEPRKGIKRLELNLSGRYEDYSDVGNKTVPKLGVVYAPTDAITVRGSWGKSFRAPSLTNLFGARFAYIYEIADPESASGASTVLVPAGGNPGLHPETATTWTSSIDFGSEQIPGFSVTASYFDIRYQDRIGSIDNFFTALANPINAPFVTRAPSASDQQEIIDSANGGVLNNTPNPYDPSVIAAIVDFRKVNIARQRARGVDLLTTYDLHTTSGETALFLNASYMTLDQRLTVVAPEERISGTAFNPPRFRTRGGVTWRYGLWSMTGIVNYLGDSENTFEPTRPGVGSWTTADAQLAYGPPETGALSGVRVSISVQNIFDRDPPFLQFDAFRTGLNYDSVNVTPLGRYISVAVSKNW